MLENVCDKNDLDIAPCDNYIVIAILEHKKCINMDLYEHLVEAIAYKQLKPAEISK